MKCEICGAMLCNDLAIKHHVCKHLENVAFSSPGDVGTELARIIPKLLESETCYCKAYAAKMDRWGIVGCEERFSEIVEHLVKQAKAKPMLAIFGPINRIVAERWIRQAIDAAKAIELAKRPDNGEWFVAVTTAPRKNCTLEQCAASLRRAGWEPTIFAEPGSTKTFAETVWNEKQKGVWHNWLSSAKYAIEKTDANIILTVQDDTQFHSDSRSFTESILWPSDAAFVSLYTPKHYSFLPKKKELRPVGVNRIRTKSLWGACAIAWPREILERVIHHPRAKTWLGAYPRSGCRRVFASRRANPTRIANSDTAIGKICNALGKSMYFIDPSPSRHIARHSTINHGGNDGKRNCYRCSDHTRPLAEQVLRDIKSTS